MGNALSSGMETPNAPNPQPRASQSGGNALAMAPPASGTGPQAPGGAPQQPPPPPSHQQTVAALRHFDAIERELMTLLANPDVGKTSMKSEIIDGTTRLVSAGILTPATAVTQLGTVPERPFDQKRWLEIHLQQTIQAADMVLGYHAQAFAGQEMDSSAPSPDNHGRMIAGLASQYQGNPNAG